MSHSSNSASDLQSDRGSDDVSYLSDWRMGDSVGTAVVLSVADYTGRHPTDLPLLSTAIDPDALDALLDGPGESVTISFSYAGCELSLSGDGELTIR
ncbi:MAG: HalOD1 output domain-containing protein [Euryarchaeota archaeon]|nr:HalOD1 output domain-containing protein [Euryarchaeota archaeon]